LQDTGAEVVVAQDQLMPLVRQVLPQTRLRRIFVTSVSETLPAQPNIPVPESVAATRIGCPDAVDLLPVLAACTAPAPRDAPDLDAAAALNYTGGTTGLPKGCIHTQRDMIYTAATVCGRHASAEAAEHEVSISFYPLFWIAGENTGLIVPVFCGATLVELARWDPVGWMAAVERYKVTAAGMLVDNAVTIIDHPDASKYDLRSLRRTGVSSFVKKLNTDYRRRFETLTGVTMAEAAWGMTETHTHDTFTTGMQAEDWDLKQQPIFVGLPVPGTEFKICDFMTGAILPLGEEGEIVVRSPSQLKGYWNKPEATTNSIRDGWLHTGDIGVLDKAGFLHFLGRRKEMLKVTGMSVFPAEIEAMLGRHPAVMGSGVVGRADEMRGQMPVAFVLLARDKAGTLSEKDLTAWCRANMATYKVPEIRFVDSLPMTATGKVKKEELVKMYLS
jgi:long-chain acyl-CoA synthetase